jgi:hypothetical protein
MEDSIMAEWKKELRVLLDQLQSHPSADSTRERDRIAVLNRLIAGRTQTVDA